MLPVTALEEKRIEQFAGPTSTTKGTPWRLQWNSSIGTITVPRLACADGCIEWFAAVEAGLGPRSAPSQRWGRITQLRAEFPRCLSAECFGTRRPRRDDRKLLHLTASCSAAKELRCAWQSAGLMRSGSLFQIVPG